ncbi:vWA domain-containing protein [Hyalangium rubrum]|uniref:VWA domain-containing protein n=1 Tax=Hyalangium rubrum TaxID=3103134 RepID=A0ABU5H3I5_9BACT|nr:VWA domain-containing protein [Hyalangium sp. s54d21]MDY7228004.1 VWA domain-containing protein [Hyalangium sp. s54d21]
MNRPTCLGTCALLAALLLSGLASAEEPEVPEYAEGWKQTWLEAKKNGSLQLTGKLSTPSISPGTQELFAVLELRTVDFPPGERAPASVALVIDRSASTAGRRLLIAKKTALALISGLSERDQLAIVLVGNAPEVFPLQPVTAENREKMKAFVEEAQALGRSDLSGGLDEAIATLNKNKEGDFFRQVILFSDGQATEGMVDAVGLAQIARDIREDHSIHVNTVAIGEDANLELMAGMAKEGWGFAASMNDSSEVERVAKRQRWQLMQRAADKVVLRVKLPSTVSIVDVLGHESSRQGDTLLIPVGELGPGEVLRTILQLSTTNTGKQARPLEIAQVELQYENALTERTKSQELALKAEFKPQKSKAPPELDTEALQQVTRSLLTRQLARATETAAEGDVPGATKLLEETRGTLKRLSTQGKFDVGEELAMLEAKSHEIAPKPAAKKKKR